MIRCGSKRLDYMLNFFNWSQFNSQINWRDLYEFNNVHIHNEQDIHMSSNYFLR